MERSTAKLLSGPGCFLAKGQEIDCRQRPLIMGIVNVTPDSFYDGGRYGKPEQAVAHALELLEQGADILDVGAESTRPGSENDRADVRNDGHRRVAPGGCRR